MKRTYFIKLVIVSLLPLIAIIASYLSWIIIYGFITLKVNIYLNKKTLKVKPNDSNLNE